jgi:hypothetical protein
MAADSTRLDYRSTRDAAGDDARAMRRSVRTWALLAGVWSVGLGVWVVYLAMIGFLFLRFLA